MYLIVNGMCIGWFWAYVGAHTGTIGFDIFWMNDVSVIRVSRCGITRGTLSSKHVLTLIWMIITGGSFKIVSNWAVLTTTSGTGVPWCGNSLGLFPWSQDGHLPDYLYVYMFWCPRLNVIDDDTLYVLLWNIYVPEMCISLVNVEWNGIDRCMVRCWAMQWSLYSIAIKVGLWSKDSWTGIVRT